MHSLIFLAGYRICLCTRWAWNWCITNLCWSSVLMIEQIPWYLFILLFH